MTQHITPIDPNQHEIDPASRLEKMPETMRTRVIELRAAIMGVDTLSVAPEAEVVPITNEPTALDDYRAQKERTQQLSAKEIALQLVNKAHEASQEAA